MEDILANKKIWIGGDLTKFQEIEKLALELGYGYLNRTDSRGYNQYSARKVSANRKTGPKYMVFVLNQSQSGFPKRTMYTENSVNLRNFYNSDHLATYKALRYDLLMINVWRYTLDRLINLKGDIPEVVLSTVHEVWF